LIATPPVFETDSVMPSYERLAAWKLSYEMALQIYDATDEFPRDERYGLTSQLRRAAFSVAANISEDCAKRGRKEFARYLDIAIGSVTEIEVGLRLARDRGYLDNMRWHKLESSRNHAGAVTWRLLRAMRDGK